MWQYDVILAGAIAENNCGCMDWVLMVCMVVYQYMSFGKLCQLNGMHIHLLCTMCMYSCLFQSSGQHDIAGALAADISHVIITHIHRLACVQVMAVVDDKYGNNTLNAVLVQRPRADGKLQLLTMRQNLLAAWSWTCHELQLGQH